MIITIGTKKIRSNFNGKISELIKKLAFSREEVLVRVNGKLVPEDAKINSKDNIEIIKVVFGG